MNNLDDETDMKELEKTMRSIEMDGLVWGASKLVPIAFGVKKLQINLVVEDEKVSLDDLQERIGEDEDHVQSTDVVSFSLIFVPGHFITNVAHLPGCDAKALGIGRESVDDSSLCCKHKIHLCDICATLMSTTFQKIFGVGGHNRSSRQKCVYKP